MTAPRQSRPGDEESPLLQARRQQQAFGLQLDALLESTGLSAELVEHVITRAARDPLVRGQLEEITPEPPTSQHFRPTGPAPTSILARNPRALRA